MRKGFFSSFILFLANTRAASERYVEFFDNFLDRLRDLPVARYSTVLVAVEDNMNSHVADALTKAALRRAHETVYGLADHAQVAGFARYGVHTGDKATTYCRSFAATIEAGKFGWYDRMVGVPDFDSAKRPSEARGREMQRAKFEAQLRTLEYAREEPRGLFNVPRHGVTGVIDRRGRRVQSERNDVALVGTMAVHIWLRIQARNIYAARLPAIQGLPDYIA